MGVCYREGRADVVRGSGQAETDCPKREIGHLSRKM